MKEDVREPVCGVTGTVGQDHSEGPLGPLEYGVRAALAEEGFAPQSTRYVIDRMRRLSRWMEQHDVESAGLTPEAVAEFLTDSSELKTADRGLGTLLRLLRSQSVVPLERDSAGDSAAGMLLAQYRDYMTGERGLAAESVRCYLVQGRKLIDELGEPLGESLRQLDAAAVTSFIMRQSRQAASTWSAKTLVTGTRSLLRFLHVKGLITAPLAGAVPAVAGWRLSALPRGLEPAQVEAILAAPDPESRSGLRDRAILMLLARLGLRGAEAAGLQLADIDWQAGEITVTGKGSQTETMPLAAVIGTGAGRLPDQGPSPLFVRCGVRDRPGSLSSGHPVGGPRPDAAGLRSCGPAPGRGAPAASLAGDRGAAGGRPAQRGRAVAPAPEPALHERLREDRLRAARAGRAAVAAAGRDGGRGMTAGKTLREHAEEYLAMRRALGFSLTTFGIRLDSFITWLESTGATVITSDAAIAWATATRRGSTDPAYLARRLDVARIFARHMQVLDPATEVPPMDVLSRRYRRITPHLYPPAEIAAILQAAGELSPPLRAATWQTILALLAATRHAGIGSLPARTRRHRPRRGRAHHPRLQVRQVPRHPRPPDHGDRAPRLRADPGPALSRPGDHSILRVHPRHQDRLPQHALYLRHADGSRGDHRGRRPAPGKNS
jgi:integrase